MRLRFLAPAALAIAAGFSACGKKAPAPPASPGSSLPAGDPTKAFAAGEDALRRGEPDAAVRAYHEALSADPRFFPAWVRYHEAMRAVKQSDQVRADFASRLQASPEDPLWLVLVAISDPDGREQRLQKAIKIDPGFSWAHYAMADVLIELKRYDEAVRAADRALQLDPKNGLFHLSRGNALLWKGSAADALVEFRKAADLLPGDERPHVLAAQALIEQDQVEEAVADLERAVKLAPAADSPRRVLRDIRMKRGEMALSEFSEHMGADHWGAAASAAETAIRFLEPVVEEDSADPVAVKFLASAETAVGAAWMGKAAAASREGKFDDALAECDKALPWLERARNRKVPDEVRIYLAQAYLRLGAIRMGVATDFKDRGNPRAAEEFQRARAAFEACLVVDPENRTARGMADEIRKIQEK